MFSEIKIAKTFPVSKSISDEVLVSTFVENPCLGKKLFHQIMQNYVSHPEFKVKVKNTKIQNEQETIELLIQLDKQQPRIISEMKSN